MAFVLASCHESMEDKAAREMAEYTQKNCPVEVGKGVSLDSMYFNRDAKELCYCYTLSGANDTTLTDDFKKQQREALINSVRNAPSLKAYKEAGLNFRYTYYSQKEKGKVLFDCLMGEKDYQ